MATWGGVVDRMIVRVNDLPVGMRSYLNLYRKLFLIMNFFNITFLFDYDDDNNRFHLQPLIYNPYYKIRLFRYTLSKEAFSTNNKIDS